MSFERFADPILVMNLAKVFGFAALSFIAAILWTPFLTNLLYRYRLGKNIPKEGAPIMSKMHAKKSGTPTMGGLLIWVTTFFLIVFFGFLAQIIDNPLPRFLNFLSRKETWLPLFALVASGLLGLLDDYVGIRKIGPFGGLRMRHRIFLYLIVAVLGAWWFYYKLGFDIIHVPGIGDFQIGLWYIPLFILVIVATAFSVNESDGLDGLAGGILLTSYGAYSVISFAKGKVDLATFCAVIAGGLLAFLWFNVYPARFFMGDTGAMSLGVTLGIIAMLTNSALVLPIIAFPLIVESLSVIIQVTSKKLFKRKVFISAPIHHHFEAMGWPETKITMRFWIIAIVSSAIGLVVGLVGGG